MYELVINFDWFGSDTDLLQPFQRFGFVQEVKLQADKGFAFVK